MKNLNQTQNNTAVETKERGTKMQNATVKKVSERKYDRKLSTAYEQNMIEMFGYIYLYPGEHTLYSLAHEFQKNGIEDTRKIQRMINDFNTLCPCIKGTISEIDDKKHFSILEGFTEEFLDASYKRLNNATLLYCFLKAFFFEKLSVKEIMEKTGLGKRKAIKMINAILDTTYLLYDEGEDKNIEIGNDKFFDELA